MYNTIPEFLSATAQKYPNKHALYIRRFLRTTRFTYRELEQLSLKTASFLMGEGLKPEDTVIIWAPNMPEWVLALFGSLCAGIVVVPVGLHSSVEVVKKYIDQTNPKIIFVSRFYPINIHPSQYHGMKVIYLENLVSLVEPLDIKRLPHVPKNALAEIVFTSGTTGEPKGVMISHYNIIYQIQSLSRTIPHFKHYRMLSILPLSHVMEQIIGLIGPLMRGATIYYIPRINTVTIKKALKKYRVTDLGVVPQMLRMFLDNIEYQVSQQRSKWLFDITLALSGKMPFFIRRLLFASLHKSLGGKLYLFGVGSSPLDVKLARTWEAFGIKVVEGYGASEMTGSVTANRLNDRKLGSVGKKLPGMDIQLSDEGEILVKGPNITKGYYNNPEKTKAAFTPDGYYKSGDIGYFDKTKHLYITGRDKFKIVTSAGDKVYPEDVERKLNSNPEIWDSCVFGLKKGDGEEVYASIILKPGVKSDIKNIIYDVNKTLEFNQQILNYSIWQEKDFPRLHTLKVDRNKVKAFIESNGAGKITEVITEAKTSDNLIDILSKVCNTSKEKITEKTVLVNDLKLDSLKRVELVSLIEEEFDIEISEEEINPDTKVKDLRVLLSNHKQVIKKPNVPSWPTYRWVSELRNISRNLLLFPLQNLFATKIEVTGKENLRHLNLPAIFIFNHVGHYDATLIIRILPKKIRLKLFGLGDALLYKKFPNRFAMYFFGNAYPIDKFGGSVKNSLEFVVDFIERGMSLVVSPEGQISPDGKQQPFKEGVAMLAIETGVPVVPIKIFGYRKIFPKIQEIGALEIPEGRGPVTIVIGSPIYLDRNLSYAAGTKILEHKMREIKSDSDEI